MRQVLQAILLNDLVVGLKWRNILHRKTELWISLLQNAVVTNAWDCRRDSEDLRRGVIWLQCLVLDASKSDCWKLGQCTQTS